MPKEFIQESLHDFKEENESKGQSLSVEILKKSITDMTFDELRAAYDQTMKNIEQSYIYQKQLLNESERRIKLVSEKPSED